MISEPYPNDPYINVQTALPIPANTVLPVNSIKRTMALNSISVIPIVSFVNIYDDFLFLSFFLFTFSLRKILNPITIRIILYHLSRKITTK